MKLKLAFKFYPPLLKLRRGKPFYLQVIHNFARMVAQMESRERTGDNISENGWQVLPGGAQIKIVDRDADPMPVKLINCSSKQDFGEAIEVIDKEIVKPKGKLMRLASAIKKLGRPKMREEAVKEGERKIEEAMDNDPEKVWK